jgi:hypothetical protein
MPCWERNAEMLAGVEFSLWAIQTSVMPCETHSRISDTYGFNVALTVDTRAVYRERTACVRDCGQMATVVCGKFLLAGGGRAARLPARRRNRPPGGKGGV